MITDSRWGIVYCPKHERLGRGKKWERVEKCLRENNIEFDFVQSENSGSVERLVKMLINNGYRTIVIVGGDSALNDAVNCLMQVEKNVRDRVALGVIPHERLRSFLGIARERCRTDHCMAEGT